MEIIETIEIIESPVRLLNEVCRTAEPILLRFNTAYLASGKGMATDSVTPVTHTDFHEDQYFRFLCQALNTSGIV